MSKYQALIDALKAGPTEGPWEFGSYAGGQIRIGPNGESKHCHFLIMTGRASVPWDDTEESKEAFNNAAYIAAANPATISSLLADLERAEKDAERYRWLRNESWAGYNQSKRLPEVAESIVITRDGAGNVKTILAEEAMDAAIDAALSQLKGVQ